MTFQKEKGVFIRHLSIDTPKMASFLALVVIVTLLAVVNGRMLPQKSVLNTDQERALFAELHKGQPTADATATAWCEEPIAKAPVNFPANIVGRAEINYDMFSGYVNVTQHDFLFYWLTTTVDKNPKAPLVIWTNGGPGCSAMEAATTENGPLSLFQIKESCSEDKEQCDYTNQFSPNKYSWNQHANVVYLDQPRFVGNSGGDSQATYVHSSVDAAADFVVFYRGFIELFPEFKGRPLIISGESYGGHYIPAFAQAILDDQAKTAGVDDIPFAGAIIGNGCTDDSIQNNEKYAEFLHSAGLIPSTSNPKTRATADSLVHSTIGYTPNYYDYRLQSINCPGCFGYNYNDWSHFFIQDDVKKAMNVCGNAGDNAFAGTKGGCIDGLMPFDANDKFDYVGALANTLSAGVPVTFYYGKMDTACNYVGGMALAEAIEWAGQKAFVASKLAPLEIAGAEVGQVKGAQDLLVFMQVDMAGHMVGLDEGAASSAALMTIVQKYRQ